MNHFVRMFVMICFKAPELNFTAPNAEIEDRTENLVVNRMLIS